MEVTNVLIANRYGGACIAAAHNYSCCAQALLIEQKKLIVGLEHVEKYFNSSSPVIKSFHLFKAREKLIDVTLQDIYPRGQKCALIMLKMLAEFS